MEFEKSTGNLFSSLDTSPLPQAERDAKVVENMRKTVEYALRHLENSGENIDEELLAISDTAHNTAAFLPSLSTIKSNLRTGEGHSQNDFLSNCSDFSALIYVALRRVGISARIQGTNTHDSLVVPTHRLNVYIDPTIGQLIRDHSQIFVGTEQQLVNLVTSSYNDNNMVNISYYSSEDVGSLPPNPTVEDILRVFYNISQGN